MKGTLGKDEIKELSKEETSKIALSRSNYHVILNSSQLGNILKSVLEYLQFKKKELNTWFKGYVLHYDNIKVLDKVAPISYDNCIHINIAGDFYIFSPEIGDEFEVVVVQKNLHYINCLLYGSVHVGVIHKNSSNIQVGDIIKVKVSQKEAKLYLNAEFICKCEKVATETFDDVKEGIIKEEPLNKSIKFEDDEVCIKNEPEEVKIEEEKIIDSTDSVSSGLKKSKRKRQCNDSDSSENGVKSKEDVEQNLEILSKPKKHKHKKSKESVS
ncbi:PREDICTED: DNA-directed RNA polymerase I subunit RPA43-like [Nicrophorus vespilloides]|uniref:DNA-directed RNA polymerase I subunit RPA43-like n=1 Tax=Nicrophorus vespilloides TaxID=110193 RepID=A0ABM1MGZ8_NICVS|nr:PREDICTED: DNA-directed RNA polymerase I subunit RPA43-like [Nicrophorus vespilloides]